jgi:DNA replication protein DnaC
MDRQQKVIEIIQSDPLGGYLFFGPTGVGKTHLMYALVDHAIRAGRRTVAMTCSQFIKMSRDSEFNKEETPLLDQDLISIYTASEEPMGKTLHVFLDEMDKIKLSEYSQLLLFDLVNAAYDYPNRIKITITSNLPPVDFEQAFGAAFLRKLKSISKPIIYGVN